jgi:putative DNA methylase
LLALVRAVSPVKADAARELAYRLYTLCERKKRAQEALAYNALVVAWPELMRLAEAAPVVVMGRTAALF